MREQRFRLTLARVRVLLLLLCALLPLPGLAGTFTAFGPETYERVHSDAIARVYATPSGRACRHAGERG